MNELKYRLARGELVRIHKALAQENLAKDVKQALLVAYSNITLGTANTLTPKYVILKPQPIWEVRGESAKKGKSA